MTVMLQLTRDDLNNLQYPVVVEMWDKVMGSGVKRRKYTSMFTEKQRRTIRRYRDLFHKWYLVKGTPEAHTMKPETLILVRNAIAFFGTI